MLPSCRANAKVHAWQPRFGEQYWERIAGLAEEIEAEARADREARGGEPLGTEAILRQEPHTWPNQTRKSPAPLYMRPRKLRGKPFGKPTPPSWRRSGRPRRKLKTGDWTARFPLESFPPGLPFVSVYTAQPP